jgi:hypothetical protein
MLGGGVRPESDRSTLAPRRPRQRAQSTKPCTAVRGWGLRLGRIRAAWALSRWARNFRFLHFRRVGRGPADLCVASGARAAMPLLPVCAQNQAVWRRRRHHVV